MPLSNFVTILLDAPLPRPMTYFLNGPYKGVCVYQRCAMGLGSETALEELVLHVLGEFLQEGSAAKVANNLCVGTDILSDLFLDWERILAA